MLSQSCILDVTYFVSYFFDDVLPPLVAICDRVDSVGSVRPLFLFLLVKHPLHAPPAVEHRLSLFVVLVV